MVPRIAATSSLTGCPLPISKIFSPYPLDGLSSNFQEIFP